MKIPGLLIVLFLSINVFSQSPLLGYWEGGFIKNGNSLQRCNFTFFKQNDSLKAIIEIEDWLYYQPLVSDVLLTETTYKVKTQHGHFTLFLDKNHEEIIGKSYFSNLHLKKAVKPNKVEIKKSSFSVNNGNYKIDYFINEAKLLNPKSVLILVHGRGCSDEKVWQNLPKVIAQRGYSVVTYNNRGSEASKYPCSKSTLEDKALDLSKLVLTLKTEHDYEKIGIVSISAGIWTALKCIETTDFPIDFLGSWVGPATSIREQQKDCNQAYIKNVLERNELAIAEANSYLDLSSSKKSDKNTFMKMTSLIDSARLHGWYDVLEKDDIPRSVEMMDELWIRRHQYDPENALKNLETPFLSILAEKDNIVPAEKNAKRFQTLFEQSGKSNYKVVILPSVGHSLEKGHCSIELKNDVQNIEYFKFDKVASGMLNELFDYLNAINF